MFTGTVTITKMDSVTVQLISQMQLVGEVSLFKGEGKKIMPLSLIEDAVS